MRKLKNKILKIKYWLNNENNVKNIAKILSIPIFIAFIWGFYDHNVSRIPEDTVDLAALGFFFTIASGIFTLFFTGLTYFSIGGFITLILNKVIDKLIFKKESRLKKQIELLIGDNKKNVLYKDIIDKYKNEGTLPRKECLNLHYSNSGEDYYRVDELDLIDDNFFNLYRIEKKTLSITKKQVILNEHERTVHIESRMLYFYNKIIKHLSKEDIELINMVYKFNTHSTPETLGRLKEEYNKNLELIKERFQKAKVSALIELLDENIAQYNKLEERITILKSKNMEEAISIISKHNFDDMKSKIEKEKAIQDKNIIIDKIISMLRDNHVKNKSIFEVLDMLKKDDTISKKTTRLLVYFSNFINEIIDAKKLEENISFIETYVNNINRTNMIEEKNLQNSIEENIRTNKQFLKDILPETKEMVKIKR